MFEKEQNFPGIIQNYDDNTHSYTFEKETAPTLKELLKAKSKPKEEIEKES